MKKKFDGKDGKVVFIGVEPVAMGYPEGTFKVEVTIYPVGPGCYSSFIYTDESVASIENAFSKIAELFLTDGKSSYSSEEISDKIIRYLNPIFPEKQR
jgi:hypothetical protein